SLFPPNWALQWWRRLLGMKTKFKEGDPREREGHIFAEVTISVGETEAGATEVRPVLEVSETDDGASGESVSGGSEGDEADDEISETGSVMKATEITVGGVSLSYSLGEKRIYPPMDRSSEFRAEGHLGEEGEEYVLGKPNQAAQVRLGGDIFSPSIDVKSDGLIPIMCNVENGMKPSCLGGSKENKAKEDETPIIHAHKVFAKMPHPPFAQDTTETSNKLAVPKGVDECLANKA
ncbi:hypothetical protein U1Q18_040551, partial [Sarracenia purpurea var. burkii]